MKIGLKYCGGCNPGYDRVKMVEHLEERLAGTIDIVPWHDESAQGILIVSGCATSCVDGEQFAGRPLWRINNPDDAESFIEAMRNHRGAIP